ncbi:hypothetical protein TrVGV298_007129 [Trichoderma virens]|nr:hypothetical protein TrVGV298_007129 [Trichoderma virens]
MLFSLRMMALDAVADKSADDKNLSGNTDDDLSRLGSNQQHSLPETQEMDDIKSLLVQDESMDVDYPLSEDTIPDCEHDMNWQEFIPNSEPPPESDTFLQQVIDSGAFQTKEQSPTRGTATKNALHKRPVIVRPRTPSVTIIIFPFRHDPDFIGHEAILHDLVGECSKPPARLALVGIGGIGKTQLAIELAYRLVKLAKMSVFWINAESRLSIEEGFKSIAWNAASWRQETDADGANEDSISHIEASLPKSQNGAIIVTTRLRDVAYRLTGGSQDVIEVGPLSVYGAVTLLENKLGRTATERFSKSGVTSSLVKSLGLIPLAICRAAAYIQHLSPKLPIIKDNDYATGNPLVDDKQYTGDRFPFGPTKGSLNIPLNVLSPKISPPDDFRPRTGDLNEGNSLDDTFIYEDDEDDSINDYGYCNKSKDRADNRTGYLRDFGGPGFDEVLMEREGRKKALLQVEKQLAQLRDNEQEKIKLLEFEVFSSDRSGQTLRSLFGTWKSSLDAIHSKRPSAIDLLSLMSFFDRRGIPKWLLRPSKRDDGAQQSDVPPIEGEGDMNDEIDASLNDDMDMLMNHCLITANSTKQVFSMHGLVQLSVKNNMDPFLLQAFEQQFIKRLAMAFPKNISSNWATCEELSAHVQLAVNCHPSDHLLEDWASLLHNWGRFSRLLGRYEIAMQTADQVLIAREKIGMDSAKTLTLIALIHMDRGVYDRAEELFSRVADIYNRSLRLNDTQAWISMNNLASMYKVKGQWKEAEEIHIQVGIRRVDHYGHDHPRTLASKANLASAYKAQGRYFQAERLQKEVVEGYKNKLGLDHHLTLTSMSNLGSIYRLQGKLLEAESLQVQAMESLKIKFGVEHADTLASMNSLASTYRARGLFDKAEALQEQVMEIRNAIFGSDHPSTLASMNNLALTCSAQGNHGRAAKLQSTVVEVCKAKLGPEHPHTLTSLNNIALIWKGQGRDADGKWKMDECVETRLRILGQNHPYTIASMKAADKWWDPV